MEAAGRACGRTARGRDEFFVDHWGFETEMTHAYEFDRRSGRRQVPLDSRWSPTGFEGPGS